jgi:hypothetical protein
MDKPAKNAVVVTEQGKATIERTATVHDVRQHPDVADQVVFKCPVCHMRVSAVKDKPYLCVCGATITFGKG